MALTARKTEVRSPIADVRLSRRLAKDFKRNKYIYLMLLPVVVYYLIFHYGPMYGIQIAFKDFSPARGMWGSPWVGFQHFADFFNGYYFWRVMRNTFLLSLYSMIIAFPSSILLALLLNEVRSRVFKRTVQSVTYLPHFISMVVVVGMMVDFLSSRGLINQIVEWFGGKPIGFLTEPGWFRTLYIASGVWQGIGWGSIIYLAAIANIDPTLYEASRVDGAGRFRQMLHITLPGIMPTILILFILNMGSLLAVDVDKILLMYNPLIYETSDVIGTYVYRKGILQASYSYSTAVGLFNAVVNFIFLIMTNRLSRRMTETKLW
ncbi:ABC transporter permease [Paenibacillus contaminans]|uniref:Sugar ABC transporter permease n=1 Tax=Paenibacillus contaminans TaxID=450362 RepID=A0A329LVC3_9BACL|nr:ABC transporter permease subunit [Paenibacillus contaminans]RAV11915.1 sugar ABC transporter permease [Paenibacillus contaminans]